MASVWLALLIGAGVNAGWLFHALMRADVQFRGSGASSIDAAETGRILAGVLAQPAFVAVFVFGLLAGPLCAWLLLKQAQGLSRMAGHLRISAAALVLAGLAGAGQLLLARSIATRAEARTEALVSADISRATEARSELDRLHRWSERIYAGQSILVALGMTIMLKPAARREVASSG